MSKIIQNFYKTTISLDWSIGTGNFYITTKPTSPTGWLVLSPNNSTIREIVEYSGTGSDANGDFITVITRGVGGTTEQTHTVGEPIRMNVTAEYIKEITDAINNIVVGNFITPGPAGEVPMSNGTDWESKPITQVNKTLTITSSATPSINTNTYNRLEITAQAENITSMTSGLGGSPNNGDELNIRINSGARTPAISYIANYATNVSSSQITLTKPTGTTDGDIMFVQIRSQYAIPNGTPAGWKKIADNNDGSYYISLYYKIASSEPASYVFYFYTSMQLSGVISTFRGGFNILDPVKLNQVSNIQYITSDTISRGASFNVVNKNSPLLAFHMNEGYSTTKPTTPTSDWVEHFDTTAHSAYSMTWTGNGDTGNMDITLSGTSIRKHTFVIALNPTSSITWGSKFSEIGYVLPTSTNGSQSLDLKFRYNDLTSKWETAGFDDSKVNLPTFWQKVPIYHNSDTDGTISSISSSVASVDGNTFIAINNATTTNNCSLVQRDQLTGQFTKTFNSTYTIPSSGFSGPIVLIGDAIYTIGYNNPNWIVHQMNIGALSGTATNMTNGTFVNTTVGTPYMWGDGTYLYIGFSTTNLVKKYSISGTTLTEVDSIAFNATLKSYFTTSDTTFQTTYFDGTSVYLINHGNTSKNVTVLKLLNNMGTSFMYVFSKKMNVTPQPVNLINCGPGKWYFVSTDILNPTSTGTGVEQLSLTFSPISKF